MEKRIKQNFGKGWLPDHFPSSEEFKAKERKKRFEITIACLQELSRRLETEALEGEYTGSLVYQKQQKALEELAAITEGILSPHPMVSELEHPSIFISHSKKNEVEGRNLYLSVQKIGLDGWFDAQETNVAVGKTYNNSNTHDKKIIRMISTPLPPRELDLADDTTLEYAKGIPLGGSWDEAVDIGLESVRYGLVLLTTEALDKFDIVGGQEIQSFLDDKKQVITVCFEGEKDVLLARLNTPEFEKYRHVANTIKASTFIEISRSVLQKPSRAVGIKVLESIGVIEKIHVPKDVPLDVTPLTVEHISKKELGSEFIDTANTGWVKELEDLPANKKIQKAILEQRIHEAFMVMRGITNPVELVKHSKLREIAFPKEFISPNYSEAFKSLYAELDHINILPIDMVDTMHPPKNAHIVIPITKSAVESPDFFERIAYFKKNGSVNDNPVEFLFIGTDTLPYIQVKLKSLSDDKRELFNPLFREQGLVISLQDDFKNIDNLAAYIVTKQCLADSARDRELEYKQHLSNPL